MNYYCLSLEDLLLRLHGGGIIVSMRHLSPEGQRLVRESSLFAIDGRGLEYAYISDVNKLRELGYMRGKKGEIKEEEQMGVEPMVS